MQTDRYNARDCEARRQRAWDSAGIFATANAAIEREVHPHA